MKKLDEFTKAYLQALLWSNGEQFDELTIYDFEPETFEILVKDCQKFQELAEPLIDGRHSQAGHDFALTQNGHGAGFWEIPDWPKEIGQKLCDITEKFGEINLFLENGKAYHL